MNNFTYYNPTRIVFGAGSIAEVGKLVPAAQKVMLTWGGGSIKRNGVYEQVMRALAGREVVEFGGVQPNPLYEHCMEGLAIVKQRGIGFLLAVGGGSVLDATKFIAAAARFEGSEPWDILTGKARVAGAMPVGCVLTLPATGSEMNGNSVISRRSTQEKLAFGSEHVCPRFAILDPQTTLTLPTKQTRNGIVDAFVHVMEQYATYPSNAPLQDRQAEAVLQTLVEYGPKLMAKPEDYDLRASIMWAATHALNGVIGCGVPQDWTTHQIGHELTAFYGIDHAESLAIVMPALWRHQRAAKGAKLRQYGARVWNVSAGDEAAAVEQTVARTEAYFHSLGMPTRLADYGISAAEAAERVSQRFVERGAKMGEHKAIGPKEAAEILRAC